MVLLQMEKVRKNWKVFGNKCLGLLDIRSIKAIKITVAHNGDIMLKIPLYAGNPLEISDTKPF